MSLFPLTISHPQRARLWDRTKNGNTTPDSVTAGSNVRIWCKCPIAEDHVWTTKVCELSTCPFCAGKRVALSNCLATPHPEIAGQWHPTRNGDLTPHSVTKGSNFKAWWQCPNNSDHVWQATIHSRTRKRKINASGCPFHKKPSGAASPFWKGCGEISGGYWAQIKRQAYIRGLPCTITIDYVWRLFLKQGRKCKLSGETLAMRSISGGKYMPGTASLDRIDSTLGYVEGNLQWIHKKFQVMKMAGTDDELLNYANKLVEYQESVCVS